MDDFIAHNPNLQTEQDALRVLGEQSWIVGDGFFYMKTDNQCLEVRSVADVVQSLDMLEIDWSASKDRNNDTTIMIDNQFQQKFSDWKIEINPFAVDISTQPSVSQGR